MRVYMDALAHGETPLVFDFWSGMWVLSSAIGRNVVVNRPQAQVYLNLFVLFISESGMTRRSTSINFACDVLSKWIDYRRMKHADVVPLQIVLARESPGSLESRLVRMSMDANCIAQAQSGIAINSSELSRFLGREAYNTTMPALLTDLYDCPDRRTSGFIKTGEYQYNNVYLTFLGGTAPIWLEHNIQPAIAEGGLSSRTLFLTADRRKQLSPWAPPAGSVDEVVRALDRAVMNARTYVGRGSLVDGLPLTEMAVKRYIRWYKRQRPTGSSYLRSFAGREADHVLRCAALLSISDGSCVIDPYHLAHAERLIDECRDYGSRLFGGRPASDAVRQAVNKVIQQLTDAGTAGMRRTDLSKKTRHLVTNQQFQSIIEVMNDSKMIDVYEVRSRRAGRPTIVYRGTKFLTHKLARDMLIDEISGAPQ